MKNILLGCLLSTAVAVPAFAALKEGDKAPTFTAKASLAGKAFDYSLANSLKKGPVVVYFYPSAFTQGATSRRTRSRRTWTSSKPPARA